MNTVNNMNTVKEKMLQRRLKQVTLLVEIQKVVSEQRKDTQQSEFLSDVLYLLKHMNLNISK